jgi:hypothetical protein
MANPFQGFARRFLSGSMVGELLGLLPVPVREGLSDVRDYLAEHGHFPKLEAVRRAPVGSEALQAVAVFLGPLRETERLSMVNLFKGDVEGGQLRATNLALGDVRGGNVNGVNALVGTVHAGRVERVNLLVGDVRGGELQTINIIVGDVHAGRVQCQLLIGDVYGGQVQARKLQGTVHGGDAQIERKL